MRQKSNESQRNKRTASKDHKPTQVNVNKAFHLDFLHPSQEIAWTAYQKHDLLFLIGPAGCGKSHLATAFAAYDILQKRKEKMVVTRPVVEAGESLGFLPGDLNEKIQPYMMPIYDCLSKICGPSTRDREILNASMEICPLAYMRGRAIVNSENLITPDGLKPIGKIKVGDFVIGSDGKPTKVIGVYPQGKRIIYEISFSDHTKSLCSGDHLWSTMTLSEKRHNKGYTIKNTLEIMDSVKNKYNQKIHKVPLVSSAVQFNTKVIGIDPYLLGVLLGDGHMGKGFSITTTDIEIVDECIKVLPPECKINYRGQNDFRISPFGKKNSLIESLEQMGVWGHKSHTNFVPDDYKYNSIECRLAILQGLLDTDGCIFKHRSGKPRIQFYSTSKQLAEDVMFLVRSLGGLAYSRKRDFDDSDSHMHKGHIIRHVHSSYVVDIMIPVNPFRLPRKANQYTNNQQMTKLISSVKEVGEEECTCIKVAATDHLFLTNDFLVTHNTFNNSIFILDEAQNCTYDQLKLAITRLGLGSKMIITGDPDQSDLPGRAAALEDVVSKLSTVTGVGVIRFKETSIVRHPLLARILKKL